MMLLNLLVSNMVYNYLTLYRSFAELAVRARAELVLRAEEIMPTKKRTLFYERCMFHEKVLLILRSRQPCHYTSFPMDTGRAGRGILA